MKQAVVASVFALLLGIGRPPAADFPPPVQWAPVPPPVYSAVTPGKSWSGFYVGVNGGYALGSSQWSLNGTPTNIFSSNGALIGGTFGFNFPISEVLVGFEGDADWAGIDGNVGNCAINGAGAVAACETKSNFLGTARLRVGYQFDRTLPYVTGGAAFGNTLAGLNPPANFDSAMRTGWAAGAGIEYAFFDNWSAKAEYLFISFGSASCTTIANCGTAAGASVALTENLMRAGLNYRFSW
jgi:outer membrane immunogenic protein